VPSSYGKIANLFGEYNIDRLEGLFPVIWRRWYDFSMTKVANGGPGGGVGPGSDEGTGKQGNESPVEIESGDLLSYAVDVWVSDTALLTDAGRLLQIMRKASEAGSAVVLGETFHVFPNGAVSAVLLLSASHLSVNTWPEYSLANVDLLVYGRIKGDLIIETLAAGMSITRMNSTRLLRAVH